MPRLDVLSAASQEPLCIVSNADNILVGVPQAFKCVEYQLSASSHFLTYSFRRASQQPMVVPQTLPLLSRWKQTVQSPGG